MYSSDQSIANDIAGFFADPLGFVMYAFPWGEVGGPLADETGPDQWQIDVLNDIKKGLENGDDSIQIAVSSGHGIGKSALFSWIILWSMSTRPNLSGVITAGTVTQLETKTWRELAVWHKRCINHHWFKWLSTKFFHVDHPETWFVACVPWREENPDAFAGQHEKPYNVLIGYDEASTIPDVIWDVSEGAMTTKGAMWFVFGNPTKNTGRFREVAFADGKFAHRWKKYNIDSRTCKMTNKAQLQKWMEDYGENSDFYKVRVRGLPPSQGDSQFISTEIVSQARRREFLPDTGAPLLMGVDPARFGMNDSIVMMRQGHRVDPMMYKFHGLSTVELANKVGNLINSLKPDAVFIDGVGIGGAVIDILKSLRFQVFDVQSGSAPDRKEMYLNKRAELWGEMRNWLRTGAIPQDDELYKQLISIEYSYNNRNQIVLEGKKDMESRGQQSPDKADALALTFAMPVHRRDQNQIAKRKTTAASDYDIFNF